MPKNPFFNLNEFIRIPCFTLQVFNLNEFIRIYFLNLLSSAHEWKKT